MLSYSSQSSLPLVCYHQHHHHHPSFSCLLQTTLALILIHLAGIPSAVEGVAVLVQLRLQLHQQSQPSTVAIYPTSAQPEQTATIISSQFPPSQIVSCTIDNSFCLFPLPLPVIFILPKFLYCSFSLSPTSLVPIFHKILCSLKSRTQPVDCERLLWYGSTWSADD